MYTYNELNLKESTVERLYQETSGIHMGRKYNNNACTKLRGGLFGLYTFTE